LEGEASKYDYRVVYSLRRSWIRRNVLKFLVSIHPEPSYPQEIARRIGARSTDVLGALRGSSKRYKKNFSLVKLGLVEVLSSRDWPRKLYRATTLGVRVWRDFSEESQT
jgi:predicted transcriptional regulator with HTH domain